MIAVTGIVNKVNQENKSRKPITSDTSIRVLLTNESSNLLEASLSYRPPDCQ
jgi:hypothetical protein